MVVSRKFQSFTSSCRLNRRNGASQLMWQAPAAHPSNEIQKEVTPHANTNTDTATDRCRSSSGSCLEIRGPRSGGQDQGLPRPVVYILILGQ